MIPAYNNTLGVFNVLKPPKLKYATYEPYAKQYKCPNDGLKNLDYLPNIRQVKVEDFEYVLNPASNLEVKSIEAAIQLKNRTKMVSKLKDYKNKNINNFVPKPVEFGDPNNYPSSIQDRYKESGFIIEQWPENFPNDAEMISLRSRFVPLGCFKKQSLFHYAKLGGMKEPIYNCKFKIKLGRKDGQGQDVLLVRTFPFELTRKKGNKLEYHFEKRRSSTSCPPDFYPTYLTHDGQKGPLMSTPFRDISRVKNLKTTVNQNVTALDKIVVYNNATISSGVTLKAGNEIVVLGQNTIPNDVKLKIGSPLPSCTEPVDQYQATSQKVKTFCQYGENYEQRTRMKKPPIEVESDENIDSLKQREIGISLRPNPVENLAYLSLKIPESSYVRINVKSVSGQIVKTDVVNRTFTKGYKEVSFNTRNLSSGFYICTIQTRFGRKTVKFVKQ